MAIVGSVLGAIKTVGKALALLLVVFSTISYLISLALGPILFFSTSDGLSVASRRIQGIPIDLFMAITVPIPLPVNIGLLFISVWAAFVICLIFAWYSRGGFLSSIRNSLKQSPSIAKTNFLYAMPLASTALLYATILIQQFQEAEGVQTGNLSFPPSTSPYVVLINLAFAPLREEFAFRITSIGIPLGIFLLLVYRYDERVSGFRARLKLVLLAMLSPERAKAEIGHKNVSANGVFRGISPLEWILILLTSAVFGLAHYLLGGGWQIGKISTAFLVGLFLGIMFVAYGAYASILIHWFFNYYFTVLEMAGSTYGGVFPSMYNVVEATNLVAGQIVVLVFLIISALKVTNFLVSKASGLNVKSE